MLSFEKTLEIQPVLIGKKQVKYFRIQDIMSKLYYAKSGLWEQSPWAAYLFTSEEQAKKTKQSFIDEQRRLSAGEE